MGLVTQPRQRCLPDPSEACILLILLGSEFWQRHGMYLAHSAEEWIHGKFQWAFQLKTTSSFRVFKDKIEGNSKLRAVRA